MFQTANVTKTNAKSSASDKAPLKLSLGIRWVGEELDPYPCQGRKSDGLPDAHQCMNRVLKEHHKSVKRKRRRELRSTANIPESVRRFVNLKRRRLKPYGVYVAIPVYLFLALAFKNICQYIPGYERAMPAIVQARDALGAAVLARLPSIRPLLRRITQRSGKSFISF